MVKRKMHKHEIIREKKIIEKEISMLLHNFCWYTQTPVMDIELSAMWSADSFDFSYIPKLVLYYGETTSELIKRIGHREASGG